MKRILTLTILCIMCTLTACTLRIGGPSRLKDAPAPTTIPLAQTAEPATLTGLEPPEKPIALPPGFAINVFASGLQAPRMMAIGPDGALYVAERGANRIVRLPDLDADGKADGVEVGRREPERAQQPGFSPGWLAIRR